MMAYSGVNSQLLEEGKPMPCSGMVAAEKQNEMKDQYLYLLGRSPAPAPPRRDPRTTLSVGRARAKSMVAGLGKSIKISISFI